MNRKLILLLLVALSMFSFALAKAKSAPYTEDSNKEGGALSNPASIWNPDAAAVHAGRLGVAGDVDAFTVDFSKAKATFQFQMFVPVCGQHFLDFRPSVA